MLLGEKVSLLIAAYQSVSFAPRWWPVHPTLGYFNIILTPISFHRLCKYPNSVMITIISYWNTTNSLDSFISLHSIFWFIASNFEPFSWSMANKNMSRTFSLPQPPLDTNNVGLRREFFLFYLYLLFISHVVLFPFALLMVIFER